MAMRAKVPVPIWAVIRRINAKLAGKSEILQRARDADEA